MREKRRQSGADSIAPQHFAEYVQVFRSLQQAYPTLPLFVKEKFKNDLESTEYSFYERPYDTPYWIEHFYHLEQRIKNKVDRGQQEELLEPLQKIRQYWQAYWVAFSPAARQIDFDLLHLFQKIKNQPRLLKDQKSLWDELIKFRYQIIYLRHAAYRQADPLAGLAQFASRDQERFEQALAVLVDIKKYFNIEKADTETKALLEQVKRELQEDLLIEINITFNSEVQATAKKVIPVFDVTQYTAEQIDRMKQMCQQFLVQHPTKALDERTIEGQSFNNILTSIRKDLGNENFLVNEGEYLRALINRPDDLKLDDVTRLLHKIENKEEFFKILFSGVAFSNFIAHSALLHSLNILMDFISGQPKEELLAVLQQRFVVYLGELLNSNQVEAFFKAVNSQFYFLLQELLSSSQARQLEENIHSVLNQYMLHRMETAADEQLATYVAGENLLEWNGRYHPEQLNDAVLRRCERYLVHVISQLHKSELVQKFESWAHLAEQTAAIHADVERVLEQNVPSIQKKRQKIDGLFREILAIDEQLSELKKQKQQAERHLVEVQEENQSRLHRLVSREATRRHEEETAQAAVLELARRMSELAQEKEDKIRKKQALEHKVFTRESIIELAKSKLSKQHFLDTLYGRLLSQKTELQAALLQAIDRYIAELAKTDAGLSELQQRSGDLLFQFGEMKFYISDAINRFYFDALTRLVSEVVSAPSGDGERSDMAQRIHAIKEKLDWVDFERVLLAYVENLPAKQQDSLVRYQNLLRGRLLELFFGEDEQTILRVKEAIKKTAFSKNLFAEIDWFRSIAGMLEKCLQGESAQALYKLENEHARRIGDVVPEEELGALLRLSVRGLNIHWEQPRHFYMTALHAFVVSMYEPSRRQTGGGCFKSPEEVQEALTIYQSHYYSCITKYNEFLQQKGDLQTIVQELMQHLQFLYQAAATKPYLKNLDKDLAIMSAGLLERLSQQLVTTDSLEAGLFLVDQLVDLYKAIDCKKEKQIVLDIVKKAFQQWLHACAIEQVPQVMQSIKRFIPLLQKFSESTEAQALLQLINDPTGQDSVRSNYVSLTQLSDAYEAIMTRIDMLLPRKAGVNDIHLDAKCFHPDFIAFLRFGLPKDEKNKLYRRLRSRAALLNEQHPLLKNLLLAMSEALYAENDLMGRVIENYVDTFSTLDGWSEIDLQLVLVYGTPAQAAKLHRAVADQLLQQAPSAQAQRMGWHSYPEAIRKARNLGVEPYREYALSAPQGEPTSVPLIYSQFRGLHASKLHYHEVIQFYAATVGSQQAWDESVQSAADYQRLLDANKTLDVLLKLFDLNQTYFLNADVFRLLSDGDLSPDILRAAIQEADVYHQRALAGETQRAILQLKEKYGAAFNGAIKGSFSVKAYADDSSIPKVFSAFGDASWDCLAVCVESRGQDTQELIAFALNYVKHYFAHLQKKEWQKECLHENSVMLFAHACHLIHKLGNAESRQKLALYEHVLQTKAAEQRSNEFIAQQFQILRNGLSERSGDAAFALPDLAKKLHDIYMQLQEVKQQLLSVKKESVNVEQIEAWYDAFLSADVKQLQQLMQQLKQKASGQAGLQSKIDSIATILAAVIYAQGKIVASAAEQRNREFVFHFRDAYLAKRLELNIARHAEVVELNQDAQAEGIQIEASLMYYVEGLRQAFAEPCKMQYEDFARLILSIMQLNSSFLKQKCAEVLGDGSQLLDLVDRFPDSLAMTQLTRQLFLILHFSAEPQSVIAGFKAKLASINHDDKLIVVLASLWEVVGGLRHCHPGIQSDVLDNLQAVLEPDAQEDASLGAIKARVKAACEMKCKVCTVTQNIVVPKYTREKEKLVKLLAEVKSISCDVLPQLRWVTDRLERELPLTLNSTTEIARLYNLLCDTTVMLNYFEFYLKEDMKRIRSEKETASQPADLRSRISHAFAKLSTPPEVQARQKIVDAIVAYRKSVDEVWSEVCKAVAPVLPELRGMDMPSNAGVDVSRLGGDTLPADINALGAMTKMLMTEQHNRFRLVLLPDPALLESPVVVRDDSLSRGSRTSSLSSLSEAARTQGMFKATPQQPMRPPLLPPRLPQQQQQASAAPRS